MNSLTMIRELVQKNENFEFKPVVDLVRDGFLQGLPHHEYRNKDKKGDRTDDSRV